MNKIPKLRFPEFSGEWEEKKVKDIFDFYATNSYSRNCLNNNNGTVKNIHYGDIHMKFPTIVDVENIHIPFINNDIDLNKIPKECYCKEGDVIIADASEDYAEIGKTVEIKNLGNEKILSGLHTMLARDNKGVTVNGYRGYMFLNENVRKQIKILAVGAKVLGISKSNINKVSLNIPSKEEQQKISQFFTLIDKKIQKQQEKIEALQDYKKGMMQKIFSQKIRFKDENGYDYPNWQEKKLSEVLKERKTYSTKGLDYPHVTLSKDGIYAKGERYERDFLVKTEDKKYKITLLGDICYNPANLKFGVICINNYGNAIFSPIYVTFEVKKTFNNNYIGYFLMRRDFIDRVRKYEEGTVYERMAVKPEDFLKYKASFPCLKEQEKIANFMLKIDNKIIKEEEKLNLLNTWKKGLLQQMFV
jgi:type I restriction enzyme S subunit